MGRQSAVLTLRESLGVVVIIASMFGSVCELNSVWYRMLSEWVCSIWICGEWQKGSVFKAFCKVVCFVVSSVETFFEGIKS